MDGGDAGVVQVEDADALATSDRGPVGERQRAPAPADLQAEGRPDPGSCSVEAVHQTVGPVVEHDGPPVRAARARLRAPDTRTWQPSTPHTEDVGAARLAGTARRNSIAAGTTLHIGVTGEDTCSEHGESERTREAGSARGAEGSERERRGPPRRSRRTPRGQPRTSVTPAQSTHACPWGTQVPFGHNISPSAHCVMHIPLPGSNTCPAGHTQVPVPGSNIWSGGHCETHIPLPGSNTSPGGQEGGGGAGAA